MTTMIYKGHGRASIHFGGIQLNTMPSLGRNASIES